MKRPFFVGALVVPMMALLASPMLADVKTRDKTQFKLEGMLGRVAGMFGGKAAREGVTGTTALKGDRKVTMHDNTGQIVDLKDEKIYDVDYRKKEYKVTTFEEMRRRIREEQERARKEAAQAEGRKEEPQDAQKEFEIDFDAKETGARKQLAGYDTRQVIMTVTLREKGKTLDENGGFVMTSDMWLAPEIEALKELVDFEMRYFKQLYGEEAFGMAMDQMAMVLAMYPALGKASERLKQEGQKLKGTALATTTTFEIVRSKEQMAEAAKQGESGGGGIGGMIGRRLMKKDPPKQRALVFTLNHEFQEVGTSVAGTEVELPAGFKEKK
jgi:hypothetical protein